ncbi:flagellar hook-length control protein FliK [Achromobacter pestifer]|uniref:Flagellar hook-length control protein FliK n=1 Tax=Achromobacter pestifer TaxID=1353889 RepID=A0A7D4I3X6_9BURK|nr:flagellar hook-length control protein FliK [Achromobacter pestifer]QKH39300.1 flagellar hook-length control protein FliK [Achromobacter pestifer]
MNAPLPLPAIAPAAPTSIADALGAKSAPVNKKGPSFSDVLAQQRSAQSRPSQAADSRPANNGAKTSADGKNSGDPAARAEGAAASAIDEAVQTAAQAEAGALAVAAAQPAVILPQQALEIAAQAAEQVQLARGNAAAAAAAMSSGAAVLTAALNAADAAPATPAAQAASAAAAAAGAGAFTAPQAEAAAALAAREAEIAVPVITAAAKPGTDAATTVQAPVRAPAAAAPVKAETPRLAAEVALPRPARDVRPETGHIAMPEQADDAEAQVLASAQQQFQAPQHGASAQDHLAQALAAATQRPAAAPIANPAAVAAPVVPVMLQVATPVGGTHWGTELGQQVVMMSHGARQGMQTAELRLDPPDLGPLRVSLNLSDGVASASFVSAHASVRQAIETAIPQLQQALAQAGISLGQTSVGEQAAQQEFAQQGGNGSQRHAGGGQAGADSVAEAPVAVTTPRNANALVDTFA